MAVVVGDGVLAAVRQFFDAVLLGSLDLVVKAAVALHGALRRSAQADAAVSPGLGLRIVRNRIVDDRVAFAVGHRDAVLAVAGNDVLGDRVELVAIPEPADAVPLVADELVLAHRHALHAGAKVQTVAAIAAGEVVGEHAVVQAAAGVQPHAAAVLDHAASDRVVAGARPIDRATLDADPIAQPARHGDAFHPRIGHEVQMDGRHVEGKDNRPFGARIVERTVHVEVPHGVIFDREVPDDDA